MKRLLCLCALLLLLCGCTAEITAEQREIIDEYAALTLDLDGDFLLYTQALDAVGAYLDAPSDASLYHALEVVESTQSALQKQSYPTYVMMPEMFQMLEDNGNEIIDMETQAAYRTMKNADHQSSLWALQPHLEQATIDDMFMDELAYQYWQMVCNAEIEKAFDYTTINYMVAHWDTDYMPYLEETLLNHLECYAMDDYQWQTDPDKIQEFTTSYLEDLEASLMDYERFIGSQQALLYEEQAAFDP